MTNEEIIKTIREELCIACKPEDTEPCVHEDRCNVFQEELRERGVNHETV